MVATESEENASKAPISLTITHISANSAKTFTIAKSIQLQPVSHASITHSLILITAIAMPRQRWNREERGIERITSSLDGLDGALSNDRLVLVLRHSEEAKEVWDELMSQDYTTGFHRIIRNVDGGDGARLRLVGKVLLACCPEARDAWNRLFEIEYEADFNTSAYFATPVHRMIFDGTATCDNLDDYIVEAQQCKPERTIVMLVEFALDLKARPKRYPVDFLDDVHHDIQELLLYTLVGDVWMANESIERMDWLVNRTLGYDRLARQLERDDKKAADDWW